MSKNWLFLRGYFDRNNKKSLKNDSDMWVQLFSKLVPDGITMPDSANGAICYVDYKQTMPQMYEYLPIIGKEKAKMLAKEFDYVFARGGHKEYEPILKKCKNAYKIYYGAGARIVPEKDLGYSLILCDSEEQKKKCKKKYPHIKSSLWIKPAARHFKPVECEKEYDVCYVADCHSKFQEKIKRVNWVYKTAPKDLKILHLGKSSIKPPKNVTVKRVQRIDMPKWYSKCKVGIVPYKGYDSCPRVIPEMLACGLPLVVMDSVNFWIKKYFFTSPFKGRKINKNGFWEIVGVYLNPYKHKIDFVGELSDYYQENLSLKPAAEHLRSLING
ncbi:MAG: glycosyltransferase family 4 protein [PVC group bacterium]|nr:glycosyltransferase family 4 protein [PVC group bacterium]